jgi:hypothetical protein
MTIRRLSILAVFGAIQAAALLGARRASADIPLVQYDGWHLSNDGRVGLFISVAEGNGLPPEEPDIPFGGTEDTSTSTNDIHSTRLRDGFLMSILGFTATKEISQDFKVTARVGVWMNASGSRTQNVAGEVDPRELYAKIEGRWGSLLAGSDLEIFGRGGILADLRIAHEYGLGYPCDIRDASGAACGMSGFGEPFPGWNPGFVYATPNLGGFQLSLGVYDPATIDNAQLDRAPLPRFDGELKYDYKDAIRVFASGFWQVLEGTVQNTMTGNGEKDLHDNGWGAQAGAMVSLGPVMLGGAAYTGSGFSPLSALDESQLSADSGSPAQLPRCIRAGGRPDRSREDEDRGRRRALSPRQGQERRPGRHGRHGRSHEPPVDRTEPGIHDRRLPDDGTRALRARILSRPVDLVSSRGGQSDRRDEDHRRADPQAGPELHQRRHDGRLVRREPAGRERTPG